ncbi:MAG: Trk family potassium uptake protein [Chloroflexi bacterium]|nr:Trk family potassium uptake protein [Chloroflexota bacterium]
MNTDSGTPEDMEPRKVERTTRTIPVHRPYTRVINLSKHIPKPPKTLGVSGIILGFALLIAIGTVLLSLPASRQPDTEWSFITAFFTSTSAVTVTGLEVVDTASWSVFGQYVILGLIQIGGLGVMTASMFILIILGRSVSLRDRFMVKETIGISRARSVGGLVLLIVIATIVIELIDGLAISYLLSSRYDLDHPVRLGIFHAVSSFNNAGFDIFRQGSSLIAFEHDIIFITLTSTVIIAGGLGMLVLFDTLTKWRWKAFSINTRIVLTTTAFLLVFGFVTIFIFEYNNPLTFRDISVPDKIANAAFQSVTARTAGFDTIHAEDTREETRFIQIALMYIGGATGSTAGGIKVSTFAILVLATIASIRGVEHASVFGRRIGHRVVYQAGAIAALFALIILIASFTLIITDGLPFQLILFEVVSAGSTVGLSTGITPGLSLAGKLTILILMFIGRLGPLTLAHSLAQHAKQPLAELPESELAIG